MFRETTRFDATLFVKGREEAVEEVGGANENHEMRKWNSDLLPVGNNREKEMEDYL